MTVLHRSLDGVGPQPFEHYIGRLCEEFHCLPSQAWAETRRLPAGFLEQIIEYRTYAATKADYDRDPRPSAHDTALRQLVQIIEFDLAREEIATRE